MVIWPWHARLGVPTPLPYALPPLFLLMAFTLVDIDGDGHASKSDLVRYLEVTTAVPEGVKLDHVGTSITHSLGITEGRTLHT